MATEQVAVQFRQLYMANHGFIVSFKCRWSAQTQAPTCHCRCYVAIWGALNGYWCRCTFHAIELLLRQCPY